MPHGRLAAARYLSGINPQPRPLAGSLLFRILDAVFLDGRLGGGGFAGRQHVVTYCWRGPPMREIRQR
jgi:hypothetical protein